VASRDRVSIEFLKVLKDHISNLVVHLQLLTLTFSYLVPLKRLSFSKDEVSRSFFSKELVSKSDFKNILVFKPITLREEIWIREIERIGFGVSFVLIDIHILLLSFLNSLNLRRMI
jgi:hypothetical protein